MSSENLEHSSLLDSDSYKTAYSSFVESGKIKEIEINVKKKSLPERIPGFGLYMALLGVTVASLSSVIVKLITELHSVEIVVLRAIIQFILFGIIIIYKKHPMLGEPGYRIDLALRSIFGTISLTTIYMSYKELPISDASTLYFTSPVFVTIFAFFILKESLTLIHIITGILTLIGVVIVSKPEFIFGAQTDDKIIYNNRTVGIALAVTASVTSALAMINLRRLKTTPVAVVIMWLSLTTAISGAVMLFILDVWALPIGVYHWLLLVCIGLFGILEQVFQTIAFKYDSTGPIAVVRTFSIVLSFLWEVLLLSGAIEWTSILGACIITVCVIAIALIKWFNEKPEHFNKIRNCLKFLD